MFSFLTFLKIPVAYAAVDMTAFGNLMKPIISEIVYPVIEVFFGLAIIIFVYGLIQFIIHGDDEAARDKGRKTILWGTFGLFIMVSAWGIVYLISNTITDIRQGSPIEPVNR